MASSRRQPPAGALSKPWLRNSAYPALNRHSCTSTETVRVLLVEDDTMIGRATQQALQDAAHAVDWVSDGEAGLVALRLQHYDLLLLDLGLPGTDGVTVLQALRRQDPRLPVLVVTARDQIDERVTCLDLGADDYLTKPFDVKELLARMRAIARRRDGSGTPLLSAGLLSLDPASHMVTYGETSCRLSAREFALLEALMRRPGAILSRSELEERIYGSEQEVDSNTVEVLIHGLRRKLGAQAIRTVRGVGYMVQREA